MLRLPKNLLDQMLRHLQAEAPQEACGLLSGRDRQPVRLYQIRNVASTPQVRYDMDPQELLSAFLDMDARGEELVAVYHSHPASPAYPSATDQRLASCPQAVYLIVSLAGPSPEVRGFRLDQQVEEVELM
ncbi:MAG: M67 family metallopeptidase [Deinococcus sp.]|nr:M67 family metallopeptidase [Deinococcus sp.]